MKMVDFRRMAAKMDQHMQQLPAPGLMRQSHSVVKVGENPK